MKTCKRKEIRIPRGIGIMIILVCLFIIGGFYLFTPFKEAINVVKVIKSETMAVAAEKQNYAIIELDRDRIYMIESSYVWIDGRRDVTERLSAGVKELSKKFYVENVQAINQYEGRTIALIALVKPKSYFKELLKKEIEPPE